MTLPAGSMMLGVAASRRGRRTALQRMASAVRDNTGTGVFLAMRMGCVALVALSG